MRPLSPTRSSAMRETMLSPRRVLLFGVAAGGAPFALASCGSPKSAEKSDQPAATTAAAPADAGPAPAPAPVTYDRLGRADFNRLAARSALPLFWREDTNANKAVDPAEVA